MTASSGLIAFQNQKIRRVWVEKEEKWYFSVVDIVAILTSSPDPRNYWKVLRHRLVKEGSQVVTKCNRLRLLASDNKLRFTDVADIDTFAHWSEGRALKISVLSGMSKITKRNF